MQQYGIKKQYIIAAGIAGIVLIALIAMLLSGTGYGTLSLTAPSSVARDTHVAVTIQRADGSDPQKIGFKAGDTYELKIEKGTIRVDAVAGDKRAVDVIQIGGGTTKLSTPVSEQRQVQQLASKTKVCPLVIANTPYAYDCANTGNIERYTANAIGTSLATPLFGVQRFDALKPYLNGLIGMYDVAGNPSQIQYLDVTTETVREAPLTKGIRTMINEGTYPDIVAPSTPGDSHFALVFAQRNRAYLFQSFDDTKPVALTLPEGITLSIDGRSSTYAMTHDSLVIYNGAYSDGHNSEGTAPEDLVTAEESDEATAPSYVAEYSLAGKLIRTLQLPADATEYSVSKIAADFYMGTQPNQATFYYRDGTALKPVYSLPDISSTLTTKDATYAVANGTLYQFKPGANGTFGLHGLYSSNKLTVSQLGVDSQGVIFSGVFQAAGTVNQPINVYRLLGKGKKATVSQTNVVPAEPSYSGIEKITYLGVGDKQVSNFKYALGNYITQNNIAAYRIRVTDASAEPFDANGRGGYTNFELTINDEKMLKARMNYFDFTGIRLVLTDPATGQQIFDSGDVNN